MKGFQRITAPLAQKSAVALGFFDGVHLGHRAVLGAAARCAAEQELLALRWQHQIFRQQRWTVF